MIPLCLFLAMAAQEPTAEVVRIMQAGISAEGLGQHEAAIAQFRKAIALQPDFAVAYVDLGTVYMGERKYAEAVAPLKQALVLDSGMLGAQEMLGYALLFQGYASESIPYFQAANNMGGLGIAQLQTGDLSQAITHLQAGLAQHPNDPELLADMSRAAGLLSRQAKDMLLATQPASAQAHLALAGDYWALQKAADAENEYRKALEIQPDLAGAHLGLGLIYERTQQWEKAEQEFRAEAKLQPGSAEAAYRLGNALLESGKVHAARVELTRADKLQPDMPETLYGLGKAESMDGDAPAAERDWQRLLAVEKDSDLAAKAHFGLAGIYRKLGRPADAAREMQAFAALKGAPK